MGKLSQDKKDEGSDFWMKSEPSTRYPTPTAIESKDVSIIQQTVVVGGNTNCCVSATPGGPEAGGAGNITPITNRGVTIQEFYVFRSTPEWEYIIPKKTGNQDVGIHWLTLTVFCNRGISLEIHKAVFGDLFGILSGGGKGSQGYHSSLEGESGFKIYCDPINNKYGDYVSFVIPGEACEIMEPGLLKKIYDECQIRGIRIHCTRLDYKFDYVGFSPYQLRWMVDNKLNYGFFNRKNVRTYLDNGKDEEGNEGMITVYLGADTSGRVLKVYDKHAFTRLEMVNRNEWAENLVQWLIKVEPGRWAEVFLPAVQGFVGFEYPLWDEFIKDTERAYMTVGKKKNAELEKMFEYYRENLAQFVSVLIDVDESRFLSYTEMGREKKYDNIRYKNLIHLYGLEKKVSSET
jgi:hypothetical protein